MNESRHKDPLQRHVDVTITPKTGLDYRQVAEAAKTILHQNQQLKTSEEDLEDANIDPLTYLPNINQFDKDLPKYCDRYHETTGLLILDADGLKRVNELLGRPNGDNYLRAIANGIMSAKRFSDNAYRLSGDEFAIIMPDLHLSRERLPELTERYASEVDAAIANSGLPTTLYLGISIGVDTYSDFESVEQFQNHVFSLEEANKAERRQRLVEQGIVFQDSRMLKE